MKEEDKGYVDIWGDNVKIKDLGISMILCIGLALGGYILAPDNSTQPLLFGLSGGVLGFIISSIIIKPKRNITKVKGDD
ncbi:hypothetical protein F3157_13010 [Virgibacillus dakarensis]|uniref:Heme ABC transporter n=1 Tax=Lentibacillus populi TaxID=1827502 RepID=A0A9W5TYW7_9BACI|nr:MULTISPECIES: hypothetical protein [Bacillaceae]MBT2216379.1 hypothetical protein [Virgibacillus dakarensis]MTW86569.1 hypothetical protein [Virgibacillus dakarensis]GGB47018.1 hypothetical protein GCM10011409_25680 [Lentibacillus populi]